MQPHDSSNSEAVPDRAAQAEANMRLIREQADMVQLLNGLTDERLQWQSAFGNNDYTDVFGVCIPKGQTHWRQGHPLNDPIRVSARSMAGVLQVALSNHHALDLAKKTLDERKQRIRDELKGIPCFFDKVSGLH